MWESAHNTRVVEPPLSSLVTASTIAARSTKQPTQAGRASAVVDGRVRGLQGSRGLWSCHGADGGLFLATIPSEVYS